jgi:hypothetical protein
VYTGLIMARPPIELERVFLDVPDGDGGQENAEALVRFARALKRAAPWSSVLAHRHAVILGEAGSGKTTEFRQQAERLRRTDSPAFFVPLADLAERGLFSSLTEEDELLLRERIASSDDLTFFVDALDEAKLGKANPSTFIAGALRRLRSDLGDARDRARVVLSCRGTDWRADDRELVQRTLVPAGSLSRGAQDRVVRVFRILPLDTRQVRLLATHWQVPEIDGLMQEIQDAGAQGLVERPMDLEWIAEHWKVHRRLGTWSDLLESNVKAKVGDKANRGYPISGAEARRAIERLAGVATLAALRTFAVPEAQLDVGWSASTVDSQAVLAHLPVEQVMQLLSRGIFDAATFGRVRIHHGPVQEYLAACWFRELLDEGAPYSAIRTLLFPQSAERRVVPPHLRSTAAWLAGWDARARRDLLSVAPELLIADGDPGRLSPEDRAAAIRRWAELLRSGDRSQRWFDRTSLRRFGSPELGATLDRLLAESMSTPALEETLFEIAAHGRVSACVPRAYQRSIDPAVDPEIRAEATRTVCTGGTPDQQRALLVELQKEGPLPEQLLGVLVYQLFPDELDVPTLLHFLAVVEPPMPHHATMLTAVLGHDIPQELDQTRSLILLRGLLELAAERRAGQWHVSDQHRWLLRHTCNLLVAILERNSDEPDPAVDAALSLYNWNARFPGGEPVTGSSELSDLISARPSLRRRLFWLMAREDWSGGAIAGGDFYFLSRFFQLGRDDLDWLARDAEGRELPKERLLAFSSALPVVEAQPSEAATALIERLMDRVPEFRTYYTQHQERISTPHPEVVRHAETAREWNARRVEREQKQREQWMRQIDAISEGRVLDALEHIWADALSDNSDFESFDLAKAVPIHGRELVEATRSGLKRCWRLYDVSLPGGGNEHSRYRLMLAGVRLEIDEGLDVSALPPPLLQRLIRLAPWELARFPSWFDVILAAAPEVVREIFAPTMTEELRASSLDWPRSVLSMVAGGSAAIAGVCAPVVTGLLLDVDPPRLPALEAGLRILLVTRQVTSVGSVLEGRCRDSVATRDRYALWWSVWLEVDPVKALARLGELLAADRERASEILVAVCDRVWQWTGDEPVALDFPLNVRTSVEAAAGLLGLLEQYRPAEQDEDRHTYAGPDGHTWRLREKLTAWLSAIPGHETVEAFEQLGDQGVTLRRRSFFRQLAFERASRGETCTPRSVSSTIAWAERFAREPRSDRELFELGIGKLEDMRADLENGDHSIRSSIDPHCEEPSLSKLVASALTASAHGLYSATREEEVDSQKRTDIRLHAPPLGPVVTEVKIAEKCTGPQLEATISEQLVGRYMRARGSRFGILLIFSLGDRKERWQTRDSRRLGFRDFVTYLTEVARDVEGTSDQVDGLHVVAIDLHETADAGGGTSRAGRRPPPTSS